MNDNITEVLKEANISLLKKAITSEIKNTKAEINLWEKKEVLAKMEGNEEYSSYCRGRMDSHTSTLHNLRLMDCINNLI